MTCRHFYALLLNKKIYSKLFFN